MVQTTNQSNMIWQTIWPYGKGESTMNGYNLRGKIIYGQWIFHEFLSPCLMTGEDLLKNRWFHCVETYWIMLGHHIFLHENIHVKLWPIAITKDCPGPRHGQLQLPQGHFLGTMKFWNQKLFKRFPADSPTIQFWDIWNGGEAAKTHPVFAAQCQWLDTWEPYGKPRNNDGNPLKTNSKPWKKPLKTWYFNG